MWSTAAFACSLRARQGSGFTDRPLTSLCYGGRDHDYDHPVTRVKSKAFRISQMAHGSLYQDLAPMTLLFSPCCIVRTSIDQQEKVKSIIVFLIC
jgi:hypothetical protein